MLNQVMREYQARNQHALDAALSNSDVPERLREAMRYSAMSGGKRVRALLVYAAGLATDAPLQRLDAVAASVECIHAYSLIHDDLPAMDNDELRRGQATNHIQYDEATAILAGDALQTLAFELIADQQSGLNDKQTRLITLQLAQSAGPAGMVGGQMLDMLATEQKLDRAQLENVHRRKTGALINAAVMCGGLTSDYMQAEQAQGLTNYAQSLGLAFQIVDDILDIESSTEALGKTKGADQALGKATYPAIIGLAESKNLAENLYHKAIESIAMISDNTALLEDLAKLIIRRKS